MSREGNERFLTRPDLFMPPAMHVYGRGTILLVCGLAAATLYSCGTNTDATNVTFELFRQENMPLDECLETNIAPSGLFAVCEANDGSSWRVQQSDALVLVPENALREDLSLETKSTSGANFGDASATFNKPLVLTPENEELCDQLCTIAAQDKDGKWSYYAPTTRIAIQGINETLRIIPLEPLAATMTNPGSSN